MTDFTPTAKVILDSISPDDNRLTTMEVTIHRYMLPEFNTHRKFSRNSASSRAIPFAKMVEKAKTSNVYPTHWRREQRGMQGGEIITDPAKADLLRAGWDRAREAAIRQAEFLASHGVHKSVVNRLLEPFLPHTIIVSSTDFSGFFEQRCNPQAQDDIRVAAEAMRAAYEASTAQPLDYGNWHTPYITPEDIAQADAEEYIGYSRDALFKQISTARCARVSYLTQDGNREWDKDLVLYNRLVTAKPGHWSPLEHVATPTNPAAGLFFTTLGNFDGWQQLRHREEYPGAYRLYPHDDFS